MRRAVEHTFKTLQDMEHTLNQNMPGGEIILYQTADGKAKIDVKLENETVWLTQTRKSISRHNINIVQFKYCI